MSQQKSTKKSLTPQERKQLFKYTIKHSWGLLPPPPSLSHVPKNMFSPEYSVTIFQTFMDPLHQESQLKYFLNWNTLLLKLRHMMKISRRAKGGKLILSRRRGEVKKRADKKWGQQGFAGSSAVLPPDTPPNQLCSTKDGEVWRTAAILLPLMSVYFLCWYAITDKCCGTGCQKVGQGLVAYSTQWND